MPYETGEIPEIGDHVKHISNGRPGVVTHVQLNSHHYGEDLVGVKWDDGGPGLGNALAAEFMFAPQTDEYHFAARCPFCDAQRGVSCSKSQAKTGKPIEIYAIQCDHHWTLTPEQSKKLLEVSKTIHI